MTIENRFLTKFLSSYPLYKRLENNKEEFENKLHQSLFIEINKDILSIPNYIIKNAQSYIKNKNSIRELLNYSLEKLSENIFILNNKPYIKESFFEEWQEIISRVSPLIIISYYLYKNSLESMKEVFTFSVLPSIYNKRLEYLLNEKIVDTHIHLNGTTEADIVWQDVLKTPSNILQEVEDGYQKGVVQEQFEQIDVDFNLSKLNQFFSEARDIKFYFVDKLDLIQEFSLVSEIEFFIKVFEYINKENKIINSKYPQNLILSANAPEISAGVIMANFIWKTANSINGIVGASDQALLVPTLLKNKNLLGFPMIPPIESPKARPNPITTQTTVITPIAIKLCRMVLITFFFLTIPP